MHMKSCISSLFFVFLYFVSFSVFSDDDKGGGCCEESYYYVKIFEGFFPMPVRYHIYSGSGGFAGHISFRSPTYKFKNKEVYGVGLNDESVSLSGYIGMYFDADREGIDSQIGGLRLDDKIERYGLMIEFYKLVTEEKGVVKDANLVLVSDGHSYVSIIDQDMSLWSELVDEYGSFNDIEK